MESPVQVSRNRTAFHRELEHVQEEVLVLGSMVEKAVLRSVEALRNRDTATARIIEVEDALINKKRFEIEEAALMLIADVREPRAMPMYAGTHPQHEQGDR